jgi:hypothetical protein
MAVATARPAQAAINCTGVVTQVNATPEGDIGVIFGSHSMRPCYMGTGTPVYRAVGNTSPATISNDQCKTLLSLFMTAMSTGSPVTASVSGSTCPANVFPNPYPYSFHFSKG